MEDSRGHEPLHRALDRVTIQTPQGPAVVQVIDIPSVPPAAPGVPGRGSFAAVWKRWWLVLAVALFVGGTGVLVAGLLVKPVYEADALVLYHTIAPARNSGVTAVTDPSQAVPTFIELLTKPEIALMAARQPDLQKAVPWLKGLNLDDAAVQREVARKLRGICEGLKVRDTELVQIHTEKPDAAEAAAVVNAFADAFVEHVSHRLLGRDAVRRRKIQEQLDQQEKVLDELTRKRQELAVQYGFEMKSAQKAALVGQITEYEKAKGEAEIRRLAAENQLNRFLENGKDKKALTAELQLARMKRIEEEKKLDPLLGATITERVNADNAYWLERGAGKTEEHRDVILARERVRRAEEAAAKRTEEIVAAIDARVGEEQRLMVASSAEQALARLDEAKAQVEMFEKRLAAMDKESRVLAEAQQKVQHLDETVARVRKVYDDLYEQLQTFDADRATQPDAIILVAERADIPVKPTSDKRVKVQVAGLAGGLLMGVLAALMADRYDKKLRHPRDAGRIMGAPMMGMIPQLRELRRASGDRASAVVAEEFRMIRTQLLFQEPLGPRKMLCVTSPVAGDGKTSLAVNLAVSLARSGRRVLLVDADLRKPDIHNVMGTSASPGLTEMIDRTASVAEAIRKSDVELLDVLPAGKAVARPCELLSRPDAAPLIAELGRDYDHVIFDSAPLLPVSDTHVLLGMVDAVLFCFGADAPTETIRLAQQVLGRGRARLVGVVANHVRYRDSADYYQIRTAYPGYDEPGIVEGGERRGSGEG